MVAKRAITLAAVVCGFPLASTAHDLTLAECIEGSDFIKHAAMSRENGMTRENFLGRMESDIKVTRQFPPQLRWFVQDRDDEELLTRAARQVFDTPREPERHQSDFLAACTARVASTADAHQVKSAAGHGTSEER